MGKKRREPVRYHKQTLGDQIEDPESYGVRTKPRPQKRRKGEDGSDAENDELVPGHLSSKILQEARAQQQELDADRAAEGPAGAAHLAASGALAAAMHKQGGEGDSDSEAGVSDDEFDDSRWQQEYDEELEELGVEDEAALAAFMAHQGAGAKQRTLSEMILDKIRQAQQDKGLTEIPRDAEEGPVPIGLDPKVVEVYRGVGKLLSRYTAGKVPKAFKIIPSLTNWEEVLFLTEPESWTPHAVYQATRMFVSNLNSKMAQRFLALVLLPAVRNDIRENQRLHFALFQALKKATYKAGAFYKGLLLPLCASGTCTLREVVIFASVLKRTSIPVLHSAAALLRIAEMEYSGPNSFFMRVLLDKKYALPYRVIDALVDHFVRFRREDRVLPVVWHQCLLCFVQRYKNEVRREDKEALRQLVRKQYHHQVTPEVLRELDASRSRGERSEGPDAMAVQSKVGTHVAEDPRDLAPIIMDDD
ncbi:hypothetical protein N2152v2_008993 [Parachlorella kessleri]